MTTISQLRTVILHGEWLDQTTRVDRRGIYRDHRKEDAGLAFGLNYLIGFGVGSYIQGDPRFAVYKTVSDTAFLAAGIWVLSMVAAEASAEDEFEDYSGPDSPAEISSFVALGITGLNSAVSSIISWIRPFTLQQDYNDTLEEKLEL